VISKSRRESNRERIAADIEQYLAKGGEIEVVDHTANQGFREALFMNRKQTVNAFKRRENHRIAGRSSK